MHFIKILWQFILSKFVEGRRGRRPLHMEPGVPHARKMGALYTARPTHRPALPRKRRLLHKKAFPSGEGGAAQPRRMRGVARFARHRRILRGVEDAAPYAGKPMCHVHGEWVCRTRRAGSSRPTFPTTHISRPFASFGRYKKHRATRRSPGVGGYAMLFDPAPRN